MGEIYTKREGKLDVRKILSFCFCWHKTCFGVYNRVLKFVLMVPVEPGVVEVYDQL